jgi:hypothetical protein
MRAARLRVEIDAADFGAQLHSGPVARRFAQAATIR